MASNVVTHAKWGSEELKERGVVVVNPDHSLDSIQLPEPQFGETIVGTMTDEERELFLAMYEAKSKLDDMTRDLLADTMARFGETIRGSDRTRTLAEAMQDGEFTMEFENEEKGQEFFRLEKQANMLHALFHWTIAERLNKHEFVLGVRTRGRIVTTERRY